MPWFDYPAISFRGKKYTPGIKSNKTYDVIVVSSDAYVDHPAFPAAVICRTLQKMGLSVAIIAQPDWKNDSDFTAFNAPELFFAIAPGAMDSMVATYTSNKMPRKKDRFSPDDMPGLRPKRPAIIYTQIIRRLFKKSLIVLGGVEASLRRFVHYDFLEDKLRAPILSDAPADLLIYGMAEQTLTKVVRQIRSNNSEPDLFGISQTCIKVPHNSWQGRIKSDFSVLPSLDECTNNPDSFLTTSIFIDSHFDQKNLVLITPHVKGDILCFPPENNQNFSDMSGLQFNRRSHPVYDKPISALLPVQFSIQSHRGCLGKCSFCALSIHQGRKINSRCHKEIIKEAESFAEHPDFKGIIPDIGGPSANMYGWYCKQGGCNTLSCINDGFCKNLYCSLKPFYSLLQAVAAVNKVKKVFVGSGLRYDLIRPDEWGIFEKILKDHVSGQLKVAPEHFDPNILRLMRKGENADFHGFIKAFYKSCSAMQKKLFIVPYLMTSFPGVTDHDNLLAKKIKSLRLVGGQMQEFTPTPGSLATAMYYCEKDFDFNDINVYKSSKQRLKARKIIQKNK